MATTTKDDGGARGRPVDVAFGHLGLKRARLTTDAEPLRGFRQRDATQQTLLN